MNEEKVLIIDFGSQFTQLIARRARELNVYSEVIPCSTSLDKIKSLNAKAIILSGGPASVQENNAPTVDKEIFNLGLPILGICYGQQLMCGILGGDVQPSDQREFGRAEIKILEDSLLTEGVWIKNSSYQVWMSHGDKVTKIPDGFKVIASTDTTPYAIIENSARRQYGVQFHLEVVHTYRGTDIIKNFLYNICGFKGDWSMSSFRTQAIEDIRNKVGDSKVICAVSGGVDSTVVAKLLHDAIGDNVKCIFVDTGLLRYKEAEQVVKMFRDGFNIPLIHRDASDVFLSRLAGVTDPEQKRKIIGKTFIDIFDEEAAKVGGADFLAQGTLYPDVIESISYSGGPSVTIKSHHNVGGLPEHMKMNLVEPLRSLFKDEVRRLGREIGIPENMISRHPFPGPGLAIRIPSDITKDKVDILQRADAIYIEEIRNAGLYDEIWQAFAVLLPVRTVGVMGDGRTYDSVLALRAVTSSDGMTADYYHFEHSFLARVASRIVNEVKGINRVVYDITSKPPATIEWE